MTPNYQCHLSPKLKLIMSVTSVGRDKVRRCVEDLVKDIDGSHNIKQALQAFLPGGNHRPASQVDFRDDDNGQPGKIFMKAYISWNSNEYWDIFVEWADDDEYWTKIFSTGQAQYN